ncbi:epoxide hydrolase 4-like [Anticarsia gemmatalis]|uniref:epoxide hydrolase 4-like n=1 Tax=Anticarsia gemmatalis TaxID=129554 RepID=UPI003F767557
MSACSYLQRVIVTNLLTIYYSLQLLLFIGLAYLKNPFSSPFAMKLKLEPPARLTDPKYGVHKYLKVNNTVLHYVESGDPSKPLMIFIHGYPEFWYSWRHQIVEFQKDYWCIAVDMRGYGDSERPEGVSSYKVELLIEDIRDLVRQLGREKCILISHDWGGIIASKFRDVYPEIVSGIVLLASISSAAWCREIWTNPSQRKKSWYVFCYRLPFLPEKVMSINDLAFYDALMLFPDKKTTDKDDIECYKYWFRKPFALTPPINYYRANFSYDIPEIEEHKENVPMLVAHAANDPYISHSMLDTMKKEYTTLETAIVEGTGHFLQQEDPEKVNKLIRDFLSKHNI